MSSFISPIALALLFNCLFCLILALIVWMRRVRPGGTSFGLLMFSLAVWSLAAALEDGAVGMDAKINFSKLSYLGIANAPPLFMIFTLTYSRSSKWLITRNIVLMWIIPLLTLIMAFTNDFHHLVWSQIEPSTVNSNILVYQHGIYFWINAAYAYGCMLLGVFLLAQNALTLTGKYRRQTLILVIAAVIALLANVIYVIGLSPIPGMDITPFSFTITSVIFAWSMLRNQLFNIVPIARDLVVEKMSDGVLVVDAMNKIVDVNTVTARMFKRDRKHLLEKHIKEVLAEQSMLLGQLMQLKEGGTEMVLEGTPPLVLDVRVTPLKDQSGRLTARLFLLHDITARKMIEESEHKQRLLAEALSDSTIALSSILELDVVLDRILVDVKKVMGHDTANIALLDEKGKIRFVRSMGYEEKGLQNPTKDIVIDISEFPHFLLSKQKKQPIYITDTKSDPNWRHTDVSEWIRSYLGAPICLRDEVVGFINLDSATPNFFTQETAEHLMLFANQAAIAIQNARLFGRLEEMAVRDGLTGIYNYRFFSEMGEKEVASTIRYKKPLSVIMIDLDHFKLVNDQFGHLIGDELLKQLTQNCLMVMRETDIFSRYGGEEFVVLLPETDERAALLVAERLREVIESSMITTSDGVVKVTASLGVAALVEGQNKLQQLLNSADKALYAAKDAGRNCVKLYSGLNPSENK